jgi:hypothetical protein
MMMMRMLYWLVVDDVVVDDDDVVCLIQAAEALGSIGDLGVVQEAERDSHEREGYQQ